MIKTIMLLQAFSTIYGEGNDSQEFKKTVRISDDILASKKVEKIRSTTINTVLNMVVAENATDEDIQFTMQKAIEAYEKEVWASMNGSIAGYKFPVVENIQLLSTSGKCQKYQVTAHIQTDYSVWSKRAYQQIFQNGFQSKLNAQNSQKCNTEVIEFGEKDMDYTLIDEEIADYQNRMRLDISTMGTCYEHGGEITWSRWAYCADLKIDFKQYNETPMQWCIQDVSKGDCGLLREQEEADKQTYKTMTPYVQEKKKSSIKTTSATILIGNDGIVADTKKFVSSAILIGNEDDSTMGSCYIMTNFFDRTISSCYWTNEMTCGALRKLYGKDKTFECKTLSEEECEAQAENTGLKMESNIWEM